MILAFALVGGSGGCGAGARPAAAPSAVTAQPLRVPAAPALRVRLVARAALTAPTRINFALPLARGAITEVERVRVTAGGRELPAARRGLARYPDGSWRSVQLQLEVAPGTDELELELGAPGQLAPALQPAASLYDADGLPAVLALLPAEHLAASGLAGLPAIPSAPLAGTPLAAWTRLCDYQKWGSERFLAARAKKDVWLYDRATALLRGYLITGDRAPLEAGLREAALYRDGLTLDAMGAVRASPVPGAADDLKYHYAQGMALAYLLTGDDRYREGAEAVALRMDALQGKSPGYDGGDDFWTERFAGFALLALEWAALVSDDRAAGFTALAESIVVPALRQQDTYPLGYTDRDARCFAHSATAHTEPYGYDGCSPWMSAILADGLYAHALRTGGERAEAVYRALVKLGRSIARDGRDPATGKPYYWMGVPAGKHELDEYEEHWGESAFLVALAWWLDGKRDPALRRAADELVTGLDSRGEVGQLRSFNWQCRTAVLTPALLR